MNEKIDLTGQVAIVTGGGRGIGRAIAQALAEAGSAVAVTARSADQLDETVMLIEAAGGRAIALPADVTDAQTIAQVVAEVEKQLGPIALLVNNAGVSGPGGPTWEIGADEWWQCLDVNLRGPFLCSAAVLPGMVARRQGRIITVASGAGLQPWPNVSAYAVSKAAVIRFSENLATETKEHGISVFSIGPGMVRTAMVEAVLESPIDEQWLGGVFHKALAEGWYVPPTQAAQLALFLASGRADVLSGCFISVHYDVAGMVLRAEEIQQHDLYKLRLCTLDT